MPPVAKIKRTQVLPRLKKVIAKHKRGYAPRDIKALFRLRGPKSGSPPGLGFTSDGLKVLTISINEGYAEFGVHMCPGDVDNDDVVRVADLSRAIWCKVPKRHRKE